MRERCTQIKQLRVGVADWGSFNYFMGTIRKIGRFYLGGL